ncbi:MAG: pitrilysin family protein [Polyangiaceae bacterium]
MNKRIRNRRAVAGGLLLCGVLGCGPVEAVRAPPQVKPTPTAAPQVTTAAPEVKEEPPGAGEMRELSLPAPEWDELSNGVRVATIRSPALPIVEVRVVALTGSAGDGDKHGVAELTAELLKEGGAGGLSGRALVEKAEAMGAALQVSVTLDRTALSLGVTKDRMAEALSLLGAMASKPAMSAGDLAKLRKRRAEEAADRARESAAWGVSMMLYRTLFGGAGSHPYSTYDATAAEIGKLTVADCRAFHKRAFVPKNLLVVVAGDADRGEVRAAAEKALGELKGAEPKETVFPALTWIRGLQVVVVDRPKSTQSQVSVGVLGPERTSPLWPAFATGNQILGGGASGRLFAEVRERAGLAYSTGSSLTELSHGSLLVAFAGTETKKTGLAAQALLAQVERMGSDEPTPAEVAVATRFLADVTAIRLETVGALANELIQDRVLGLPDDAAARFRREVHDVKGPNVLRSMASYLVRHRAALVVSGDAKIVGPLLRTFGDVRVVDPENGFTVKETLATDPDAQLAPAEESQ